MVNCLVAAFVFGIFPLVLGIHSSNEVREALEKTNKDEFGHYTLFCYYHGIYIGSGGDVPVARIGKV